jgi:hypothetical protein
MTAEHTATSTSSSSRGTASSALNHNEFAGQGACVCASSYSGAHCCCHWRKAHLRFVLFWRLPSTLQAASSEQQNDLKQHLPTADCPKP